MQTTYIYATATDDLAMFADSLYAGSDFHDSTLYFCEFARRRKKNDTFAASTGILGGHSPSDRVFPARFQKEAKYISIRQDGPMT